MSPYHRFVQRNVQEHSSPQASLSKSDYIEFVKFMAGHGLSWNSMSSIVSQMYLEKMTGRGRWRRAFILDKLQFDLFRSVYRRIKPRFSTFFLNSTAHMQHKYWRYMQPELFKKALTPDNQREYESSILHGYQEMDRILSRILKLVGDDAIVVFATALGQQPFLNYEETGGKHCYRPKEYTALLEFAGVTGIQHVAPVMAEQFWIHFSSESDAIEAEKKIAALRVGAKRAMQARRDGSAVFSSCLINEAVDENALLTIEGQDGSIAFYEIFYLLGSGKSGMHHPDGILWIRHPQRAHRRHQEKVGLVSIAPTILQILDIDKPEYMKGQSLFGNTGRADSAHTRTLEEQTVR
jgi:hypothetical protein